MKEGGVRVLLAKVMLGGTLAAAVLIAIGLVWSLAANPHQMPGDHVFTGEPKYLRDPIEMIQMAFHPGAVGQRRSVEMIGIVLLLINPVVRVALAAAGYLTARDRLYTTISLIVLAVLGLSFFW
jgi:uncharacterized membrane protein